MDLAKLAAVIATVPNQDAVFTADKDAASAPKVVPVAEATPAKTPDDIGRDGQAWHVFNTLRGAADLVTLDDGSHATFADVRALIAQGKL